ncbi:methylated-DNA--[protein]-cysteine S-methyltransferase [Actinorugispora endophytica]|uniref:Methylated-DNA-[protein]-cysteine S-methyltransferase n=1 Tax=Actinorugispora endophytica TaxID=1605990 RepID=A0A4R6UXZ4_9ACTN|nr:methylated-DNA--[protein]-cysteine S-methyltransferase [Actinorugispora endophytica]TDQ52311.1 methylated-DNA-[protein]-cysteine S-methyltransferase [Actinorugispora endophytica]
MTRTWRDGWPARFSEEFGADEAEHDLDALVQVVSATPPATAPQRRTPAPGVPFDVVTGTAETPVGFLSLALTERGLVSCSFDPEEAVLPRLARAVSTRIGPHDAWLDPVRRELNAYFEGRLTAFTIPLDLRLTSDFGRVVLRSLLDVPYGSTTSYAALAARIGHANAIRAVANTLATNPLCLFLPCHRVVPAEYPDLVGAYAGGSDAKRYLLTLEHFKRDPR